MADRMMIAGLPSSSYIDSSLMHRRLSQMASLADCSSSMLNRSMLVSPKMQQKHDNISKGSR